LARKKQVFFKVFCVFCFSFSFNEIERDRKKETLNVQNASKCLLCCKQRARRQTSEKKAAQQPQPNSGADFLQLSGFARSLSLSDNLSHKLFIIICSLCAF
jgi:hypothetical protein